MANTFNNTVNESVGFSYVKYSGSLDFTGALEDSHYTQAFKIAEANNAIAGYFSRASGGGGTNGDIQVTFQVSNDKENWIDISTLLADHDATADQDALLGHTNYEAFKAYEWGRLKADGQASNDYTTLNWSIVLTKNDALASSDKNTLIGSQVADSIE